MAWPGCTYLGDGTDGELGHSSDFSTIRYAVCGYEPYGLRASFEVIQASCWQTEAQDEFRPDTSFPVPSASQHESCSCFTTCGRLRNGITQSIRKASARLVVLTQSLSSLPMTWSIRG